MGKHSFYLAMGSLLLGTTGLGASFVYAANQDEAAHSRVDAAVKVVDQMKQQPELARWLARADGVFIIPHYGKGGFIVGGQGGGGVLLERHGSDWSYPAFYSIAGGSVGAQAGGEAGAVAMILMTPKALHKFEDTRSTWSLNGNAGLTVVSWSGKAQANTGRGDVIVWSDTNGLYGGLTASVTDISADTGLDRAYYGRSTDARQILADQIKNRDADALRHALDETRSHGVSTG